MQARDWLETWEIEQIRFHKAEVHPDLLRHSKRLLGKAKHRVLVPLCGKTLDMPWLVSQGHEVVGIELSPIAAEAVFEENGLAFSMRRRDGLNFYEGPNLTIICGDIFKVRREHVGDPDRVWDRAAMVALSPSVREAYVAKIRELASPGHILLSAFGYDETLKDGPPYAIPQKQIRRIYPEMEVLAVSEDVDSLCQEWRDLGLESWLTTTYLIDI